MAACSAPKELQSPWNATVLAPEEPPRGPTDEASERERLLLEFNATAAPIAASLLTEPFERQAAATPERLAVLSRSGALRYAELDARANHLAWKLIEAGIGPEQIVAVCLERSVELVVAVLAVLKSGAAYLTLDP